MGLFLSVTSGTLQPHFPCCHLYSSSLWALLSPCPCSLCPDCSSGNCVPHIFLPLVFSFQPWKLAGCTRARNKGLHLQILRATP